MENKKRGLCASPGGLKAMDKRQCAHRGVVISHLAARSRCVWLGPFVLEMASFWSGVAGDTS